jgi:hypothetical protein
MFSGWFLSVRMLTGTRACAHDQQLLSAFSAAPSRPMLQLNSTFGGSERPALIRSFLPHFSNYVDAFCGLNGQHPVPLIDPCDWAGECPTAAVQRAPCPHITEHCVAWKWGPSSLLLCTEDACQLS